jgi:carbon monoxide dehydrogenase subunit G
MSDSRLCFVACNRAQHKDHTNEMGTRVRAGRMKIIVAFSVSLVLLLTYIRMRSTGVVAAQGAIVTEHASGTFEVKLAPSGEADKAEGSTLGSYSLDKEYHGDLEAIAKGMMLTAGTDVKGSAGYVAIERVTGTLKGHKGSFVLQHNGTLTRGTPQQNIIVVPDSGTGELVGLTGKLTVMIESGKHSYEFDYSLPPAH